MCPMRSHSGTHFPAFRLNTDRYEESLCPAFGLNTERYEASLRIQSECGKMLTRITPNTETFYAVIVTHYIFTYS